MDDEWMVVHHGQGQEWLSHILNLGQTQESIALRSFSHWQQFFFTSSNQGKNATLCVTFWLGLFLFEIENACVKKLKQDATTSLSTYYWIFLRYLGFKN